MKDEVIAVIACSGIAGMTILGSVALYKGMNGTLLSALTTALGTIVGFVIGKRTNGS